MKICVITPYFYPHFGGSERYIEDLYTAVQKLQPSVQVDVICYNTELERKVEKYKNFTIYRVGCIEVLPGQFAIPNYLELMRVLRKLKKQAGRYDLVNSHTRFFENSWWAPLAAKYLGAKSLLTDHCADLPYHPAAIVRGITTVVDRVVIPLVALQYDQVTTVSEATKNYLQKLGVKKHIQVIPCGVDTSFFDQFKTTRKSDQVVVTFLGRMIPSKNPDIVLAAVQNLLTKYPQLRVKFAGTGPLLRKLRKQANSRTQFLGSLDKKQVARLLQATDILVQPSRHHEGLPMVILEAGAANCAVIATDRGGTKELIEDGVTGLITQPTVEDVTRKLEDLILHSKKREQLAKKLHQKIHQHFEWSVIAQNFATQILNLK